MKAITTIILSGVLYLTSCYSVMPISHTRTDSESKVIGNTYIVYYDASVGTDAIETFIRKNNIEVLYRYTNLNGYALKLKSDKQRTALEKTKGVLSVQEEQIMQIQ